MKIPGVILCLLALAALLLFPRAAVDGALSGLRVCGASLVPALLPYFILTRLLASQLSLSRISRRLDAPMRLLFGVEGGCFSALLFSFLGGYPAGISVVASLYESGKISKQSAQRALCFCNNSGPAFFFGVAGPLVLHSKKAGIQLYCIHVLASLCSGILLAHPCPQAFVRKASLKTHQISFFAAFSQAVAGACAAVLQISGLVVFFSAMAAISAQCNLLGGSAAGLAIGLLELTSGILRLSGSWNFRFLSCALLLGWGGLCVHAQASAIWNAAGLHPTGYLPEKAMHAALSALFAAALLARTPQLRIISGCIVVLCVLFPLFRKKRTGNLSGVVV